MRTPTELDLVQWPALTHAYGSAEDVPELIRALYQDGETAGQAIYELWGNIHHQATAYPVSAPAALVCLVRDGARSVWARRRCAADISSS